MMFIVISYDIEDDKRRSNVSNIVANFGKRIQYSVFECIVSKEQLAQLRSLLSEVINKEADSLRIYQLCESCYKIIQELGKGEVYKDKQTIIV
jgi:CRISPR-associated protein Cas2